MPEDPRGGGAGLSMFAPIQGARSTLPGKNKIHLTISYPQVFHTPLIRF
jgi:hypothetical protein